MLTGMRGCLPFGLIGVETAADGEFIMITQRCLASSSLFLLGAATVAIASVGTLRPDSARAHGLDVTWNDCFLGNPARDQTFLCGGVFFATYDAIFQFKSPVEITDFVGARATFDLVMATTTMRPFWHYETGGCNGPPQAGVALFDAIPNSCVGQGMGDPWYRGTNSVVAWTFTPDLAQPRMGRFSVAIDLSEPVRIEADVNYYAFHVRFNARKRDACPGCGDNGALIFQNLLLEKKDGSRVELVCTDKLSRCVSINGSGLCNIISEEPCGPTPSSASTWGEIKSLYK